MMEVLSHLRWENLGQDMAQAFRRLLSSGSVCFLVLRFYL